MIEWIILYKHGYFYPITSRVPGVFLSLSTSAQRHNIRISSFTPYSSTRVPVDACIHAQGDDRQVTIAQKKVSMCCIVWYSFIYSLPTVFICATPPSSAVLKTDDGGAALFCAPLSSSASYLLL